MRTERRNGTKEKSSISSATRRKGADGIKGLQGKILASCSRTRAFHGSVCVLGEGPVPCDLMVVGEAPGRVETELKRPFVGRAGSYFVGVLTDVLNRKRESIYITNVVKIWPRIQTPRGRTRPPTKKEEEFFLPLLREEIDIVSPRVIVAVGRTAFNALAPGKEFSPGVWVEAHGGYSIMPVYHPAYILRRQGGMKELEGGLVRAIEEVGKKLDRGVDGC